MNSFANVLNILIGFTLFIFLLQFIIKKFYYNKANKTGVDLDKISEEINDLDYNYKVQRIIMGGIWLIAIFLWLISVVFLYNPTKNEVTKQEIYINEIEIDNIPDLNIKEIEEINERSTKKVYEKIEVEINSEKEKNRKEFQKILNNRRY